MSPSGEALVFGGSGGYLHLWSSTTSPRIVAHNRSVQHLKHPPPQVCVIVEGFDAHLVGRACKGSQCRDKDMLVCQRVQRACQLLASLG